jgi:hypothetical protein
MRRFRFLSAAAALAALLAIFASISPAPAQQGAACVISTLPFRTITTSTYTLAIGDQCSTLVFSPTTAATAVALTLPNAATNFPAGYTVRIKSGNTGGVYMTPTTSTLDGLSTQINLTTGQSIDLVVDGTNYISLGGSGTTHHP